MSFLKSSLFKNTKKKVSAGIAEKRENIKRSNKKQYDRRKKEKEEIATIIWQPFKAIAGGLSSQEIFLAMTHISEILYTGSRYIGKTDAGIMCFVQFVSKGFGVDWRGVIIRPEFSALEDAIKKAKKIILSAFPQGSENPAVWKASKSDYKFVWKNGEELLFRGLKTLDDYETKMHGQELPYIFFDEITSWPDDSVWTAMRSCNRTAKREDGVKIPKMMRASCNPSGIGKRWVRDYFVAPAPFGEIIVDQFEEDGVVHTKKRMAIMGNWKENPFAEFEYIRDTIYPLKATNPPLFYEWCYGDWYQTAGTIFSHVWNPEIHKKKNFEIPPSWRIWMSYDDGYHDPYSCLFFAASDGKVPAIIDGKEFLPPDRSVIVIDEIYGADKNNRKKGLFQNTDKIAKIIKNKRDELLNSICINHKEFEVGKADYQMFSKKNDASPAKILKDNGVVFKKCGKKGKNSIENRVRLMMDMMQAANEDNKVIPHLYFTERARMLMINLMDLVADEENLAVPAPKQADHDFDALAYGLQQRLTSYF